MLEAILKLILKELFVRYPGLAWASIYTQVLDAFSHLGPGEREEFDAWWSKEMNIPGPGMEPQPNPGDPYDPVNPTP
jgi:hypothetical protein